MKRIGIVAKKSALALAEAESLRDWLAERGFQAYIEQPESTIGTVNGTERPTTIPWDVDLVVVLGGDGTLLYAARALGRHGMPLLGVNMGGLGFLTAISLENARKALERVLAGEYWAEARMLLAVRIVRGREVLNEQTVLNDAVINKGALARILNLSVNVDQTHLTNYRADGLIISTPTGSTAYNLSAGGPIVHPVHETIVVTPICPFTLTNRPIILPMTATVEVEVDPEASDVILTADGQVSCPLEPGDRVVVRRSPSSLSLITNPYKSYFEILRTKLGWG
ncbi:MAG: NAD(+)/NADH kinase [Proteobacteria bacterium]|nr:NAD(+)/NADH kinase [Pseudomonadota bacterium]